MGKEFVVPSFPVNRYVKRGEITGGGHTIEDEGTPLTQRTSLNFTGAGVSVADSGGKTVVTIAGASSNPAGSDTQVQFNDGGSFGGDAGLTYNKTTDTLNAINIANVSGNDLSLFTTDAATVQDINITAGGKTGDAGLSGFVNITSGSGTGDGGAVQITGGDGSNPGFMGGDIILNGGRGYAAGEHGGEIVLTGGSGWEDADGGDVLITAGSVLVGGGDGGHVYIQAGATSSGAAGTIQLKDATSNRSAILDTASLASTDKTFTFPNTTGTFALTANPTDITVPDEAYDATNWNGSLEVPTKNAIRDKIESMSAGSGITRTVVVTSGSATMGSSASTDYVYFVAGAHTMSLPAASGNTNRYTVKNNHSAAITIDTAGAENVEGASSLSLQPNDAVDILSDGTNWFVV